MIDSIYQLPNLVLACGIVGFFCIVGVVGLLVVTRLIPAHIRKENNDVIGAIGGQAAITYAVVLGFVAVSVWASFDKAGTAVQAEGHAATDIWQGSRPLPAAYEARVRQAVTNYLQLVVQDEWPLQQHAQVSMKAQHAAENLHRLIIDISPQTIAQQVAQTEMIHKLDDLFDARRTRKSMVSKGMDSVLWYLILSGALILLAFAWCLGTRNLLIHIIGTTLFSAVLGLIIFTIVTFDWPFRGEVNIPPDELSAILVDLARLEIEQPPTQGN